MNYYLENIDKVYESLKASNEGLSSKEAAKRLSKFGNNEFEKPKSKSLIFWFFKQMTDPMIVVLICAALISALLSIYQGEGFTDTIIILAVVAINAILGVYQEKKAEKSIEALQKMASLKSYVLRDGHKVKIESADLVPGDIVFLEAGDAVPCDGRIIECASLKIEEAALTGESIPVNKLVDTLNLKKSESEIALADRKNMAYMGSTVVYGRGKIVVTGTGMNTQMGKIAGALTNVIDNKTPLQLKMTELSKILTWAVGTICALVFVIQLLRIGSFDFRLIVDAFMIAVTLAVAAIPEGLPAVVTVVLSLGVTKMSRRNAIIRKLTAVETLGCAQIICSDKTGTLTQNKMTVTSTYTNNEDILACGMALSSDAKIEDGNALGEPTELALVEWAAKKSCDTRTLDKNFKRFSEIPFDSKRKMMTTFNTINNLDYLSFKNICSENQIVQFSKGAPDVILSLCTHVLENDKIVPISDDKRDEIIANNKKMADKALRVLACGMRFIDDFDKKSDIEKYENSLVFVGLCGMIDPVRPEVKNSIAECRNAGIRPIMITGDHIDTARAIARDLGILDDDSLSLRGQDLNEMSDEDFEKCFNKVSVYARVQPEHKTKIVNAWQKAGYVVVMTGDGVNDAPSIKTADIGVGMGITGTDVTKNVADMVLADDNFATIVNAVEEGRRIYDNIIKSIQFLLSSNMGEVICVLFASICGFVILRPVHLLWVNLVTDCFPAITLGLEEKEPDLMKRKPRKKEAGIFSGGLGFNIVLQGILVTILILISYFIGQYIELGNVCLDCSEYGTTMTFLTMSMVGCFHAINLRSRNLSIFKLPKHNWWLYVSVLVSLMVTTIICFVPAIATAFQLTRITVFEYFIAIGLGLSIIPAVEFVKFIQRLKARR